MIQKLKTAFILVLFSLSSSDLFAMAGRPNADPNAPPPPVWVTWFPILVMVFVFYFFLIRPQSKQRKDRDTMLANLKKGDKIITQGGIFATIVHSASNYFDVKINDETKIRIQKSAVADVVVESTASKQPVEPAVKQG